MNKKPKRWSVNRKSAVEAAVAANSTLAAICRIEPPEHRPTEPEPAKRSVRKAAEVALTSESAVAPYIRRQSDSEAVEALALAAAAAAATPEAATTSPWSARETGICAVAAAMAAAESARRASGRICALPIPATIYSALEGEGTAEGIGEGGGEDESEGEEELRGNTPTTSSSSSGVRSGREERDGEREKVEEQEELGEWEEEEYVEEEKHTPVITVLFSHPQLWPAQTVGRGAEGDEVAGARDGPPCSLVAVTPRIYKFLKSPLLVPHGYMPTPAEVTLRALRSIDFSSMMVAPSEDDYDDDESDASEKKEPDEVDDTDFEGIARWRQSQGIELGVADEEHLKEDRISGQDSSESSSTEETEIHAWRHCPIAWFPEEAQFEIYWDLWDPRASVRDLDEDEELIKNKKERAADLLESISNYFKNIPPRKECSEQQSTSLDESEDIADEMDWYNIPYSDIDNNLRNEIFKKYAKEFLKAMEAIKCSEEPLTEGTIENLRNLQYRAARWLIKQLDNEYSFLQKNKKDKIIIPRDPTTDHYVRVIMSEIMTKITRLSIEKLVLPNPFFTFKEKCRDSKLYWEDILMAEIDRYEKEKQASLNLKKDADLGIIEDENVAEQIVKEILSDLRNEVIYGESWVIAKGIVNTLQKRACEPEEIASNILNSIIDDLKEEDEEIEKPEEIEPTIPEKTSSIASLEISIITAKFHLENERCFSRQYNLATDLNEMRFDLSRLCEVPEDMIVLELEGTVLLSRNILMTNTTLQDIRKPGADVLDFNLKSIDELRYPLRTYKLTLETPRIQSRVVQVVIDKYETRHIYLIVIDECIVKPFVGGFRNRSTGVELHNAFTQTGPFLKKIDRTHRDTQTALLKNVNIETIQHKQTQMWRRDCYITPEYDYLIRAKPYLEADTYFKLMRYEEMAIRIQRFWRRFCTWKLLKQLADRAKACKQHEIEREQKRLKEISERHRLVLVRKTYPRTKADFDMWYAMIEKWRLEETEKAMRSKDAAGRKASLRTVHLKEVELLREMETHRTNLLKEKREKRDLALIDACAKPIEWTGKNGCLVAMDTTRTQRARELCHLYHALARTDVTLEERMEVLMQLKYALVPYPKVVPTQLIRLIERESELMLAGLRQKDQIDVLHKRVLQMYLELLKDPDFNPEAAKHTLEYNVSEQKYTFHLCPRCAKLKKKVDISMDATTRSLQYCEMCSWVQHIGSKRYDMGPYRDVMRAVRRDEAKRKAYSSVAFVMRDADFYWLIFSLWHAESFLTEEDDINEMRMPRWDVRKEWSPWNCILLTDDETKWHLRLIHLEDGYSPELMGEVHSRHVTARLHFRDLVKTDKYFRESCKWFKISRKKSYVPPSETADVFQGISEHCPLPESFKR